MRIDRRIQIAAIITIGILLRVIAIQSRGIQYDDAFTMLLSEKEVTAILSGTSADTMPPLFYILLHYWQLVSKLIWWQRLLPIILNSLAILFLYLTARDLLSESAALISAGMLAISPLMIYHAQDIRMYSLVLVGVAGYVFFFNRWQMSGFSWRKPRIYIGMIIFGLVSLYSHNLAIFFLLAVNFYLIVMKKWRGLIRMLIVQFIMALFFLPWLLEVPGQIAKIQNAFWTTKPGVVDVLQAILLTVANLPLNRQMIGVILVISLFLFTVVVIFVVRDRRSPGISLFGIMAFVPPITLFILSFFIRPVFVPRGFIYSYLAFSAITGYVVTIIKPKFMAIVLVVMIFSAVLLSLPGQYQYANFPRSPYKSMVEFLKSELSGNDLVLHDNKLSYFPSYVYDREIEQIFFVDEPGTPNDTLAKGTQKALNIYPETDLEKAIQGKDRIYFVVFSVTIAEFQEQGLETHPIIQELNKMMFNIDHNQWNDLEVFVYEKRQ